MRELSAVPASLFGTLVGLLRLAGAWHVGAHMASFAIVAAGVAMALGWPQIAAWLFGCGALSWLATESIVLGRAATGEPLPAALRSAMGVQLAPPVVGGTAYLSLTTGTPDLAANMLFGYGLYQGRAAVAALALGSIADLLVRLLVGVVRGDCAANDGDAHGRARRGRAGGVGGADRLRRRESRHCVPGAAVAASPGAATARAGRKRLR